MAKKDKIILGLDISSSSTGYAVIKNGRWSKSRKSFGIIETNSKDSVGTRLVSFRTQLSRLIKEVKPTHIVIEDIFKQRNVNTLKLLARFSGVAIECIKRLTKKEPTIVMATRVRSTLGCGVSKQEAFDYVCNRYKLDWAFTQNDITDAICLALYQHELLKKDKQ